MSERFFPTMDPTSNNVPMLAAAAGLMLVAASAIAYSSGSEETDPETHCLVDQAPPASRVIAIDTSDRLLSEQRGKVGRSIQAVIDRMQPYERLVLIEINSNSTAEHLIVDGCMPELNSNAARNRYRDEMLAPIADGLERLETRPESHETPIIETLAAIADRPDWRDQDGRVVVELYTDGMQNSDLQSFYGPTDQLNISNAILNGMHITIVPLKSERDLERQYTAFMQLEQTLSDLGATISLQAPGWLTLSRR